MYSSSCADTHNVLTFKFNEYIKIIIDYLQNVAWLLRNKKNLKLCLKNYIFRRYHFLLDVTNNITPFFLFSGLFSSLPLQIYLLVVKWMKIVKKINKSSNKKFLKMNNVTCKWFLSHAQTFVVKIS